MSDPSAIAIVREFWRLMATNDFRSVEPLLTADFVLEWPQSRERIRGPVRFVQVNAEYPAHGPWLFTVNRVLGADAEAVSDVSVTDGVLMARAISFFTVTRGQISRIVEFWPEPYSAPKGRAHLVEPMD